MRKILLYFSLKYNGVYDDILNAIRNKEEVPKSELDNIESKIKSKYITIIDSNYPSLFKNNYKPPIVIFYYGNIDLLNNPNNIAIIGSRKNSNYGKCITEKIIKEARKNNPCIVSGMANGIDSIAHKSALINKLNTIAVLGSGIDYCYPSNNKELYNAIKSRGLIISEYPNDIEPKPENFLIRNRLIAGLSSKILVIEAALKSGTLNTIKYGLEFGKDIYAVPYLATNKSACNMLIKQGAKLVECANDIYDD